MLKLTRQACFHVTAQYEDRKTYTRSTSSATMLLECGFFSGNITAAGLRRAQHNFTTHGATSSRGVVLMQITKVAGGLC